MLTSISSATNALQLRLMKAADLPAVSALAGRIWRSYYPGIIMQAEIEYALKKCYSKEILHDFEVVRP